MTHLPLCPQPCIFSSTSIPCKQHSRGLGAVNWGFHFHWQLHLAKDTKVSLPLLFICPSILKTDYEAPTTLISQ